MVTILRVALVSSKYRFYPTKKQRVLFREWISVDCDIYNASLQERKAAYRWYCNGWEAPYVSYESQAKALTEIRAADPRVRAVPVEVARSALDRVDKAERKMIADRKAGKRCRTRYKKRDQYRSFSAPASKRPLKREGESRMARIRLPGPSGWGKIRYHRPLQGTPKLIHVKDNGKRWHIVVVCEVPDEQLPTIDIAAVSPERVVGIDVGIKTLAALSNGELIENPRFGKEGQRVLGRRQRKLSRKKKGSKSYARQKELVRRAHAHVTEQRRQHACAVANQLVRRFDVIFHEDLSIARMVHGNLAKHIYDASWGRLLSTVAYKASRAGKVVKAVNPYQTSQCCHSCGQLVPKSLSQRRHNCDCGASLDRDVNAAKNILQRGLAALCTSEDATAGRLAKARRSTRSKKIAAHQS